MVSASTASTKEAANEAPATEMIVVRFGIARSGDPEVALSQLVRRASDSHKPPPMRTVPESRPSNLTRDGFMNQARPMPAAMAQAQSEAPAISTEATHIAASCGPAGSRGSITAAGRR